MYRGQHEYWYCLHNFSPGFVGFVTNFETGLSLMRHRIPGRFTACPGTDFASFFHWRNHRGRIYRRT